MTQAVVTGLLLGGVYALVSIGLTLIFGVLGIVNFAQGAMLTLAMYLVYVLSASVGLPVYVSTLLAVPIMFAARHGGAATPADQADDQSAATRVRCW